VVERGEPPTPKGKPYQWHPPGIPLGLVWIGWPGEPDEAALAHKVGEWLLILDGKQKAKFLIKIGPSIGPAPTVYFETAHNGFGACTMSLIHDPV
jgi:hypothetical protein